MCLTLEMTYFCAEPVQLTVSRSDSELEVQTYGMKKNTLTVDPIKLQDELWMRTWKTVPKPPKSVFWKPNSRNRVFGFWILRSVQFGSVFRKPISEIFIGFRTSLLQTPGYTQKAHWVFVDVTVESNLMNRFESIFWRESNRIKIIFGELECTTFYCVH